MTLVLDASVTLAWAFEDEAGSQSLLARLVDEQAVAPPVWPLEVGNALLVAERRRRITRSEIQRFVRLLEALAVEVDEEGTSRGLTTTIDLARTYDLSTYDAAYLELAMRRGYGLATLDSKLEAAATAAGVKIIR